MFDCFYFTDIFNEKYIVKDVHKDGNCAFAALAAGLGVPHTDESMHADVIQFDSKSMGQVRPQVM